MKKTFTMIVALLCVVLTANAQSNNISLYVYSSQQQETIPEASLDYLTNALCNAVATDGLAASNDSYTQFVLIPKVNIATKNVLATTQQQVVLTLDVSLQVIDGSNGTVFASKTINLKGV